MGELPGQAFKASGVEVGTRAPSERKSRSQTHFPGFPPESDFAVGVVLRVTRQALLLFGVSGCDGNSHWLVGSVSRFVTQTTYGLSLDDCDAVQACNRVLGLLGFQKYFHTHTVGQMSPFSSGILGIGVTTSLKFSLVVEADPHQFPIMCARP